MDEYKQPYLTLFNQLTDILSCLEQGNYQQAIQMIQHTQQEAEERFLDSCME